MVAAANRLRARRRYLAPFCCLLEATKLRFRSFDLLSAAARHGVRTRRRFVAGDGGADQIANRGRQAAGNRGERVEADVDFSALDLANMLVVLPGALGELLLTPAALKAQAPDVPADAIPDRPRILSHQARN
jgi:hypothetical protein